MRKGPRRFESCPLRNTIDNGTAADFAVDLDEAAAAERVPMIRRVLERAAAGAEFLEIPDAERAVAAAALVVAQHPAGGPERPAGGPSGSGSGPSEPLPPLPAELRTLALAALDQVAGGLCGLAVVWDEAVDGPKWHRGIVRLRDVLDPPLPPQREVLFALWPVTHRHGPRKPGPGPAPGTAGARGASRRPAAAGPCRCLCSWIRSPGGAPGWAWEETGRPGRRRSRGLWGGCRPSVVRGRAGFPGGGGIPPRMPWPPLPAGRRLPLRPARPPRPGPYRHRRGPVVRPLQPPGRHRGRGRRPLHRHPPRRPRRPRPGPRRPTPRRAGRTRVPGAAGRSWENAGAYGVTAVRSVARPRPRAGNIVIPESVTQAATGGTGQRRAGATASTGRTPSCRSISPAAPPW
ncbi:DUF4259 domain-containing protein [Streptomyces griseofuscus]|uniref:DUF4259 domain-containing protein n=1 Tax=Streptomyces griseofuscus TaxID=146922 RepID=UPI00368E0B45